MSRNADGAGHHPDAATCAYLTDHRSQEGYNP